MRARQPSRVGTLAARERGGGQAAREQGGVGILAALALLVGMSLGALGASRDVLREWAICGSARMGTQAFFAADAGLDWGMAQAGGGATLENLVRAPFPGPGLAFSGEGGGGGFEVQVRYLGRLEPSSGSGAGTCLWEFTSHGWCPAGGPLPAHERYHQVIQGFAATPAPMEGAGPEGGAAGLPPGLRLLSWNILR